MVTLYDIQELQNKISDYRTILQDIKDLARTGSIPDVLNIDTIEKWNSYKIEKIAFIADKALKELE